MRLAVSYERRSRALISPALELWFAVVAAQRMSII
jgi:hypothetical protein